MNRLLLSPFPRFARGTFNHWRSALLLAVLFLGTNEAVSAQCRPCGQDLSCYEQGGYKVRKIRIETVFEKNVPLSFIFKVQSLLVSQFAEIKPNLSMKEGAGFTVAAYNNGPFELMRLLGNPDPGERFRFVYAEHILEKEDCDPRAPAVDIVHKIFTTKGLSFLTSQFENKNDKVGRSVLIPTPNSDKNKVLPQPYVQYDRSRGFVAGVRTSLNTAGGIFSRVDLDASASNSSGALDVALSGSKGFDAGLINHVDWKVAYQYSDIPSQYSENPADVLRLKGGTGIGQFFAGTHPLGPLGMTMRFGASIEGGNSQADFNLKPGAIAEDLQRTRYGAVKTYVGSTLNWGRQSGTLSYGIELGQAGEAFEIDYVRHIFDANYSIRFLPREHLPLKIDTAFSAGIITSADGQIPVGQRFYGGSIQTNFIEGDDWRLGASPRIRSFPQNGLNLVGPGLPIGGTRFFSTNLTVSQTLWKKPAIPEEVSEIGALHVGLGSQIASERRTAVNSYLRFSPAFNDLISELDLLGSALDGLAKQLEEIKASVPPPSPKELTAIDTFFVVDDDEGLYIPLPNAQDTVIDAKKDRAVTVSLGKTLAIDTTDPVLVTSILGVLDKKIVALQATLGPASPSRTGIDSSRNALVKIRTDLSMKVVLVNSAPNYNPSDLTLTASKVNALTPILDKIEQQVTSLPAPLPGGGDKDYETSFTNLNVYLAAARDSISAVNDTDNPATDTWQAETLSIGYGEVAPAFISGLIQSINSLQFPLIKKGLGPQAQALQSQVKPLTDVQGQIKQAVRSAKVPNVVLLANRDIAYTGRVLDVIFRELNLVSMGPVALFDAARIGPELTPGFGRVRYGIGGGVRFSLVTMDLTAGYAWNPNRVPGEKSGAFVFALSINDLFR